MHPLFQQYPLDGTVQLSVGQVPTPYHIYDGVGAFISGSADAAAVRDLLRKEQVRPMLTRAGRAVMGIWICDFRQASLGPHHELQMSIFVARDPIHDIADHPISVLAMMLTRPEVQMMCHGLWNNSATVVAYNRELLSLNARLTHSRIESDSTSLRFDCRDELGATLALSAQLGFGRTLTLARQPWVGLPVMNPVGVGLDWNAVAQTFTKNDVNAVRHFDARRDSLDLSAPGYAQLSFQPAAIQFMIGFKFVYLAPVCRLTADGKRAGVAAHEVLQRGAGDRQGRAACRIVNKKCAAVRIVSGDGDEMTGGSAGRTGVIVTTIARPRQRGFACKGPQHDDACTAQHGLSNRLGVRRQRLRGGAGGLRAALHFGQIGEGVALVLNGAPKPIHTIAVQISHHTQTRKLNGLTIVHPGGCAGDVQPNRAQGHEQRRRPAIRIAPVAAVCAFRIKLIDVLKTWRAGGGGAGLRQPIQHLLQQAEHEDGHDAAQGVLATQPAHGRGDE